MSLGDVEDLVGRSASCDTGDGDAESFRHLERLPADGAGGAEDDQRC